MSLQMPNTETRDKHNRTMATTHKYLLGTSIAIATLIGCSSMIDENSNFSVQLDNLTDCNLLIAYPFKNADNTKIVREATLNGRESKTFTMTDSFSVDYNSKVTKFGFPPKDCYWETCVIKIDSNSIGISGHE